MSEPVVTVEIAKAVLDLVQSATWTGNPVIERSYGLWDLDLQDGDFEVSAHERRIDIVAHRTEVESELSARPRLKFEVPIDIAIRQKLNQPEQDIATGKLNTEDIDALMGEVQRLQLLFIERDDKRLPGFDGASWQSAKVIAAPHQHLRDLRQFTGIVRVIFRADLYWTAAE